VDAGLVAPSALNANWLSRPTGGDVRHPRVTPGRRWEPAGVQGRGNARSPPGTYRYRLRRYVTI